MCRVFILCYFHFVSMLPIFFMCIEPIKSVFLRCSRVHNANVFEFRWGKYEEMFFQLSNDQKCDWMSVCVTTLAWHSMDWRPAHYVLSYYSYMVYWHNMHMLVLSSSLFNILCIYNISANGAIFKASYKCSPVFTRFHIDVALSC